MEQLTIGQAQKMTSPAPFALLSSVDETGRTNLMAVSWWTYLSNHPVKIGACLSNKGFSGGNIRAAGEFALNLVDETMKQKALECGRCSGMRSMTGCSELLVNSAEFASAQPTTLRANSMTAICIPRQMPKYGISFSLA